MQNIIITGGGLTNKGAQAMTFICVAELKRKYPEHHIYVLSDMDRMRPASELDNYNFTFIESYPQKFAAAQKNPFLRAICMLRHSKELKSCESIYKNSDLMLDISGYALGSNWDEKICNDYLDNFAFAKAFGIPFYLLPQSFGPFDFQGKTKERLEKRIKYLLPAAECICARERDGYTALTDQYGLHNVILKPDLVLSSREIDLSLVYKSLPRKNVPDILPNSVGVIPNNRNMQVSHSVEPVSLYCDIVRMLLKRGKNVYLLSHSAHDRALCQAINESFANEKNLIWLDAEYSCVEMNALMKNFDFLVASRYHSIVHAYKNCVPCIVLGWAEKYHELLRTLGQECYMFDIRDQIELSQVENSIEKITRDTIKEAEKIQEALCRIQNKSVFSILPDTLE